MDLFNLRTYRKAEHLALMFKNQLEKKGFDKNYLDYFQNKYKCKIIYQGNNTSRGTTYRKDKIMYIFHFWEVTDAYGDSISFSTVVSIK